MKAVKVTVLLLAIAVAADSFLYPVEFLKKKGNGTLAAKLEPSNSGSKGTTHGNSTGSMDHGQVNVTIMAGSAIVSTALDIGQDQVDKEKRREEFKAMIEEFERIMFLSRPRYG